MIEAVKKMLEPAGLKGTAPMSPCRFEQMMNKPTRRFRRGTTDYELSSLSAGSNIRLEKNPRAYRKNLDHR